MRKFDKCKKFFGIIKWWKIAFITLIFITGLYGRIEGAVDLSRINISQSQGEIKEKHIIPDAQKSIIIIGERHDLIQVQKNIVQILKGILTQYSQFRLIGLEGIYLNQKIENPFPDLPDTIGLNFKEIEKLKEEVAESLLETGEISAVEFIRLVNKDIVVYGVEDSKLYEKNRRQIFQISEEITLKDLQKVVNQVKERLEERLNKRLTKAQKRELEAKKNEVNEKLLQWLKEYDREGIGKLYKLISDFQGRKITSEKFLSEFEKMCRKYGVDFMPKTASPDDFSKSLEDLTKKLYETIDKRLTPEQLEKMVDIRKELEIYLGKIDEDINKLNSLLEKYREESYHLKDSIEFLKYLKEKCKVFGIAFPSSLDSKMEFFSTAFERDRKMVENLLSLMGNETNAILVVGAAHIGGITDEFRNRKISFIVIIPKGMKGFSEHEEKIYRYNLEEKALPSSLFGLWTASRLKPPARSLKPEFREYKKFLLVMRIVQALKAKGYSNAEIREKIGNFTQGQGYNVDCDGIIYSLGDIYIPCRIGNNNGVLRFSQYPIRIEKDPTFPVLRHGKIGKLFYEFIDRGHFDASKDRILRRK